MMIQPDSKGFKKLEKIRQNEQSLPQIEKSKTILKKFGIVQGFGVNTHTGLVRTANEDRVSILLNA